MAFEIEFAAVVEKHIQSLKPFQRNQIFDEIEKQLIYEPHVETRNRKLLRPNPFASWELRVGSLRVFYDVIVDENVVQILAIGIKRGNTVLIAGKAVDL